MKNAPSIFCALLLTALLLSGCTTTSRHDAPLTKQDNAFSRLVQHSVEDHRRHYSAGRLLDLLPPLALAGTLATSNADVWIRDTWQNDIRNETTDDIARVFLRVGDFGQTKVSMPAYALTMLAAGYTGYEEKDSPVATWAERSFRANVLGGPQAWAFTYMLGSHRPGVGDSSWNPWHDNDGVSGHTFFGAVPFLTAARMTESAGWRFGLYALSILPAVSRINDNHHYTSQAVMGWSLAWLATDTIAHPPDADDALTVTPLLTPDGGYLMIACRF